ncbi:MAG: extracellular solute-binding protein [Saccharofermentanales bacterium]
MKKILYRISTIFLIIVFSTGISMETVQMSADVDTNIEPETVSVTSVDETQEAAGLAATSNAVDEEIYVNIEIADAYTTYISKHKGAESPIVEKVIEADSYSESSYTPQVLNDYKGKPGNSLMTTEDGYVVWDVDMEKAGFYNIQLDYYPVTGKSSAIARTIQINNQLPFAEARSITFFRTWTDVRDSKGVAIHQDSKGNDVRPSQTEQPIWMTAQFRDTAGYINEPLKFYLNKGINKIKLISIREPMLIRKIKVYNAEPLPSYSEVKAGYKAKGYKSVGNEVELIKMQAENSTYKADPVIVPVFDRSTPKTEPNDPAMLRLNSISGSNWRDNGQFITWKFNVKTPGLYKIGIKERQNTLSGSFSTRRVYIDGAIPCKELENVMYMYQTDWEVSVLGGEKNPYEFYFDEGAHEIKMEVCLGSMADILREISDVTTKLNSIYRKILVVTGPVPDPDRDYEFNIIMPDVVKDLKVQSDRLFVQFNKIIKTTDMNGENAQILNKIYLQTSEMAAKPHTIALRFSAFEVNISALGSWIMNTKSQPLSLDYLVVAPVGAKMPEAKATVWESVVYNVSSFVASFFHDYTNISDDTGKGAVTVWVGSGLTGGRDQAQILKSMADNTFTQEKGIAVNLQLISMGALLPATLAGIGPDVALTVGGGDPVNYAARKAVVNLAEFKDFEEIAKRFNESAIAPLRFNGGVYALPETQSFPMLFYRKDIMQELNIPIPQTWDDVIKILPVLQKKQMTFGLPPATGATGMSMAVFSLILYQNGGSYYSTDLRESALDSQTSVNAFTFVTSLYNDYKIPVVIDFLNRFRTGSAPIGIADYGLYNALSIFAPELDGVWDFTSLPGVRKADGTIDRSAPGGISACIILRNTDNKDKAWEFLKWWTSSNTQVQFGRELESLLGTAARYPTANLEALYQIPWSKNNFDNLMKQSKWVIGIPEVPGGYYTPRYLDFAFRDVINNAYDPGESIAKAAKSINSEILAKRKEFGLE